MDGDNLVIGTQNLGDGTTILLRNGTATNIAFAVVNQNGPGLQATAESNAPGMSGIHCESTEGTGLVAISFSSSPSFAGVDAQADAGPGVRASAISGAGVEADSKNTNGVVGQGLQNGVLGFGRGDVGAGVTGVATTGVQGFGTVIGVYGEHKSVSGAGTSGFTNVGVGGRSNAHHGIFGFSDAPTTPGVLCAGVAAQSATQVGLAGESLGPGIGVFGRCHPAAGAGVVGYSLDGVGVVGRTQRGLAALFDGDVFVSGSLQVAGRKSAVVRHRDGTWRTLYALESPESWFEDFGSARLVRGRARVRLSPDFASVIRTADYHVFLTAEGDSRGLYVARKTARGFEVVEQQGGRSTLPFSFRVVARRPDLRGKRLEKVRPPRPIQGLDRKLLPPGASPTVVMPATVGATRSKAKAKRTTKKKKAR